MPHLPQVDEVSFTYFKKDFDKYSWDSLGQDMRAGFSVAMLTVPQATAYALVAGLPISCGLVAVIFSAMIVALFGCSRHLMVGPSNAIAILVQGGISQILFSYYRDVSGPDQEVLILQILTQLLLLVGVIQVLAAFFKLGRLTQFVSHSVIIAYVSGVALALVINQLFNLVGMTVPPDVTSLFERGVYIFTHLDLIRWPTTIIGIACFAFLIFLKRINNKIPAGAIMFIVVATLAYFIDFSLSFLANHNFSWFSLEPIERIIQDIPLVGNATQGDSLIPHFGWPYFNPGIMNDLLPVAFAIALLSVMETNSATKSVAASSGQHLSTNQEIFGLGMGHLFSAFIGAMPVSGSSSRTTISYANGAKTRLAAISNSLFVLVILLACGFLLRRIPVTAFAALLIVSAGSIVNYKQLIICLKATRSDAFVLLLTIFSCIFFSLDIAFYIGVVMSITLYLKKSAVPQLVEFHVDESGTLHSIDADLLHEPRKIRFIKVEGELFFGAADVFQTALKTLAEDDTTTRVIILQLKNARDLDATACLALQQLYEYLRNSNRYLICCGLMQHSWDVLSDSGLVELIGKKNLFFFDEKNPNVYIQKTYARAYKILSQEENGLSVVQEPVSMPIEASTDILQDIVKEPSATMVQS